MSQNKRSTILDVAAAAGVGASTVSRHVRGGKSVSAAVAKRIDAAIANLGYEPNRLARGLRGGRTETIGVLVPHVNNVFFGNAIRTIQMDAQARGFTVMLLVHEENPRLQQEQLETLKRNGVDGIVLVPASRTNPTQVLQTLGGTPVVALDRPLDRSADCITLQNSAAGRLATEHLLSHHHQQIVSVTAQHSLDPLQRRLRGYSEMMAGAGLQTETLTFRDQVQFQQELVAALTRPNKPATAIFSVSYTISIAILNTLRRSGISLHDVALIGIDDLEFATFLDPGLTMVAQPTTQLARMAMEQLLRRIDGDRESPVQVALSGELILRGSCGCNPR